MSKRKRHLQQAVDEGELECGIPGGVVLDELLLPTKLSIGIQILKNMGWKPGQGVGEKIAVDADDKIAPVKKV